MPSPRIRVPRHAIGDFAKDCDHHDRVRAAGHLGRLDTAGTFLRHVLEEHFALAR